MKNIDFSNGYTFESIDKDGNLKISKNNENKDFNINDIMNNQDNMVSDYSETSDMINQQDNMVSKYSETSDVKQQGGMGSEYNKSLNMNHQGTNGLKYSETSNMMQDEMISEYSETSDMSEIPNKMVGGSKNIFKKNNHSDTPSVKMNNMLNYSKTSSELFNEKNNKYSETSMNSQYGGHNNETSDTLTGISELKDKKSFKSKKLDMGIFKKNQSGGSVDKNIRKKMMDIGINSNSSTSSICE